MKKKTVAYRLEPAAIEVLERESERTGKTKTAVIEDVLLFRRQFGDEADAAAQFLAKKHKLPVRKVIEYAVLKAAGIGNQIPFSHLAAA